MCSESRPTRHCTKCSLSQCTVDSLYSLRLSSYHWHCCSCSASVARALFATSLVLPLTQLLSPGLRLLRLSSYHWHCCSCSASAARAPFATSLVLPLTQLLSPGLRLLRISFYHWHSFCRQGSVCYVSRLTTDTASVARAPFATSLVLPLT
jgi:hypothetical protein